jgi:hypothetical protein
MEDENPQQTRTEAWDKVLKSCWELEKCLIEALSFDCLPPAIVIRGLRLRVQLAKTIDYLRKTS